MDAAYGLAEFGALAVPELVAAMREEALATIAETEAKTPDNAHGTNPTSGCAALALASIGAPAAGALAGMLSDEHWWVRGGRRPCVGTLGHERNGGRTRSENGDERSSLVGAPPCD